MKFYLDIFSKVTYSEYANATSMHMADTMDCSVEKVCEVLKIVKALDMIKRCGKKKLLGHKHISQFNPSHIWMNLPSASPRCPSVNR